MPPARALPLLAALLLGVAAAVLVGCGAGPKRGIPAADAQQLNSDLDALAGAVDAGDCARAATAVVRVRGDIVQLPDTVSARLRTRLAQGADNLAQRAPGECASNKQDTTPTTTTPTTTTPTTTTPTTTTPTTTTPTTTTPTTTTPTTTTPTTTTPATSTPTTTSPGGTGGASPGAGTGGTGGTP